jgi:hypothetical protein
VPNLIITTTPSAGDPVVATVPAPSQVQSASDLIIAHQVFLLWVFVKALFATTGAAFTATSTPTSLTLTSAAGSATITSDDPLWMIAIHDLLRLQLE